VGAGVGGGDGLGDGAAVGVGGRVVLGGAIVGVATGSVADGAGVASPVGTGVSGAGVVGTTVGTAGTTRRVAGGETDSMAVGLTAASPRVDGACEVPAESTSQMATATALRPRTRSTLRAERMAAVTRY
jgi:hypothetical protein